MKTTKTNNKAKLLGLCECRLKQKTITTCIIKNNFAQPGIRVCLLVRQYEIDGFLNGFLTLSIEEKMDRVGADPNLDWVEEYHTDLPLTLTVFK